MYPTSYSYIPKASGADSRYRCRATNPATLPFASVPSASSDLRGTVPAMFSLRAIGLGTADPTAAAALYGAQGAKAVGSDPDAAVVLLPGRTVLGRSRRRSRRARECLASLTHLCQHSSAHSRVGTI